MSQVDLRRALRFLAPYRRPLAVVLALSVVSTILSLALPLLSRVLVDRALVGRDVGALMTVVGVFVAVTLASFIVNVVAGLRYTGASAGILFDMRLEVYCHLQRLSPRFYARTRLGDILSRVNSDIAEIQRIVSETALAWIGTVFSLAGTIAALVWLDAALFLVAFASIPFGIWALVRARAPLERQVAVLRQRGADIGSFLIETLQAVRLVTTTNSEMREIERFRARNDAFARALLSTQWLSFLSSGVPGLIFSAGTAAVFLYGGWKVIDDRLSLGTFVAFTAYQLQLLPSVRSLLGMYASLATVRVSLRRVSELLDEPIEIRDAPGAAPLTSVRGDISFENVTVSFDRGAPVLSQLSFSVRAGEIIAIVGPSGSGKSTIADLLVRLLDPDSGTVRLDGRDLRTVRVADLRRHVMLVDQEPAILHGTIADNIRYARPEASDAEVADAARLAALDPFINALPDRFQTVVGERGTALSVGERQRIATARALLARPAVLVLDEPTASLDVHSERRLIDGCEMLMRGRTTIVITHRLDVARRADRVIDIVGPTRIPIRAGLPLAVAPLGTHGGVQIDRPPVVFAGGGVDRRRGEASR